MQENKELPSLEQGNEWKAMPYIPGAWLAQYLSGKLMFKQYAAAKDIWDGIGTPPPEIASYIKKHNLEDVEFRHAKFDYFHPKYKGIPRHIGTTGRSPHAVVLHELGHATGKLANKPIFNILTGTPYRLAPYGAALIGIGSENPNTGAALALAPAVPTLGLEAAATGRALKHLINLHGWKEGLSKGKMLFPAFGTYAAIPVGAALATRKFIIEKNKNQ